MSKVIAVIRSKIRGTSMFITDDSVAYGLPYEPTIGIQGVIDFINAGHALIAYKTESLIDYLLQEDLERVMI